MVCIAARTVAVAAIAMLSCVAPAPLSAWTREQRPTDFVDAASVVDGLDVDMRYSGNHNFVGERIDGYEQPRCLLTKQAAAALALVQRDLAVHGLGLKVFDCYRPARAVAHFVRWAKQIGDVRRKAEFYPDVDKRNLFRDGYIAIYSGHSRGSTVDLTLVRRNAEGEPVELDLGTPFDFFSPKSAPGDRTVTAEQRANRRLLADAMRRRGFIPYQKEWWHFTLVREPYPATYFDFPVK